MAERRSPKPKVVGSTPTWDATKFTTQFPMIDPIETVNVCGVPIDIYNIPVGLMMSGGADSASLLYVLLKYGKNPVTVYTTTTADNGNLASTITPKIIKRCEELAGRQIQKQVFRFVDKYTRTDFIDWIYEIVKPGNIIVYSGNTRRPADEVVATFKTQLGTNGVSERRDPKVHRPVYSPGRKFYSPYDVVDKSTIAEIYRSHGILDSLFPLTRSCESETIFTHHCGECWWCCERQWAFGRLE